jgi:hypothetical protein
MCEFIVKLDGLYMLANNPRHCVCRACVEPDGTRVAARVGVHRVCVLCRVGVWFVRVLGQGTGCVVGSSGAWHRRCSAAGATDHE